MLGHGGISLFCLHYFDIAILHCIMLSYSHGVDDQSLPNIGALTPGVTVCYNQYTRVKVAVGSPTPIFWCDFSGKVDIFLSLLHEGVQPGLGFSIPIIVQVLGSRVIDQTERRIE